MTTHDDMCTCDRCMREDHDRTLQRVGDLERENARLRAALDEIANWHGSKSLGYEGPLRVAQRALEGGPS